MLPVSNCKYPESQAMWSKNAPYAEIVEQPSANSLRFRYECERRSAGSIVGENTTLEKKTYPTIKIHGYKGPAAIVISCVTKDDPPKPHPHGITGKNSNQNGIYSLKVNLHEGMVAFSHLGVQCVKKKEVREALETRKRENVDPFGTGFDHMNYPDQIDFNCLRLCFQIFIQGPDKKFNVALKPIISRPIFDKKAIDDLLICKLSVCSAPVCGGTEMILLCGKVNKDDVEVRFFELRNNWLFWEGYGEFQPMHVHKQVAIVLRTPAYCNLDINEPVTVQIQLRKKSTGSVSEPLPFLMLPMEYRDINSLKRKRMRFENDPKMYLLRQMHAQVEKENAVLNQSLLLNYPDMSPRQTLPKPFQQHPPANFPRENNNYVPTERTNFNLRHQLEKDFCNVAQCQTPVPQPRHSVDSFSQSQPNYPRRTKIANRRTQVPQPLPRRRIETPPPNVTLHTYHYRESMSQKQLQTDPNRCRKNPFLEQPVVPMNQEDPFQLNELPCNFDLQDLSDLEPPLDLGSNDRSDTISDNLSKTLSISDEIHDTFQNIQNLNKDVEQNQQHMQAKYPNYKKFDANNPPPSRNMRQIFANQPDVFFT